MMACPPDTLKRKQFVQIRETGPLRQYNSRVPVVVDVPKSLKVYYRVWPAGPVLRPTTREWPNDHACCPHAIASTASTVHVTEGILDDQVCTLRQGPA
jgi:hypothetical protein